MPLYQYQCPKCGKKIELLLGISQRDTAKCPSCGEALSRVYEGTCAFGAKKGAGGCSGNCSGCSGCH